MTHLYEEKIHNALESILVTEKEILATQHSILETLVVIKDKMDMHEGYLSSIDNLADSIDAAIHKY